MGTFSRGWTAEPRCRTLLLTQPLWDLDLHVAAWRGSVDGFHDRGESPLYARPARREQHDDRNPASGEVLLMSEVGIRGDAVATSCRVSVCRRGSGVPWSKRMRT